MRRRIAVPQRNGSISFDQNHLNATPSAAAVLRDIQASYGKPSFALPLWQIKPLAPVYVIDDLIDGQYKLGNGTVRWYPARITGVNADGINVVTEPILTHDPPFNLY